MSFRFYRRVKIAPGLTLNLSKRGVSLSAGVPGAKMTFSSRGIRQTVGIPGTGLFYTKQGTLSSGKKTSRRRLSVFTTTSGQVIEASSKDEAVRQLAMQDPSLGGTIGQRENDDLVRELATSGHQELSLNTQQAKEMLHKLKSDTRLKMTDLNGRRISIPELEAKIRRMELRDKVEDNRKRIEAEEREYGDLLHLWRSLPPIPAIDDVKAVLARKQFVPDLQPPAPVDWDKEKESVFNSTISGLKSKLQYRFLPCLFLRPKARTITDTMWANKKVDLLTAYNKQIESYRSELEIRNAKWDEQEDARIGRLQRLIAGDLGEMHSTSVEVVESINFPFDTSCDVYLNDQTAIFIALDLPEIEDVIPSHRKKALQNGEIKEVKIDQSIRNRDYFGLVVGQSILIAAHLFANLPTIKSVRIAGYTQRQRKKASMEIDTYVFDIEFPKDFMGAFDVDTDDLRPLLKSLSPVMSLKSNWELERIERPEWGREEQIKSAVP